MSETRTVKIDLGFVFEVDLNATHEEIIELVQGIMQAASVGVNDQFPSVLMEYVDDELIFDWTDMKPIPYNSEDYY